MLQEVPTIEHHLNITLKPTRPGLKQQIPLMIKLELSPQIEMLYIKHRWFQSPQGIDPLMKLTGIHFGPFSASFSIINQLISHVLGVQNQILITDSAMEWRDLRWKIPKRHLQDLHWWGNKPISVLKGLACLRCNYPNRDAPKSRDLSPRPVLRITVAFSMSLNIRNTVNHKNSQPLKFFRFTNMFLFIEFWLFGLQIVPETLFPFSPWPRSKELVILTIPLQVGSGHFDSHHIWIHLAGWID